MPSKTKPTRLKDLQRRIVAGPHDTRSLVEMRFSGVEPSDRVGVRVAGRVIVAAEDDECVAYTISFVRMPSLSLISFFARLPSTHSNRFGSSPGRDLPLRSTATFSRVNFSPRLMS